MKRISFKNVSLMGLVLMGVSALTAAFIPSEAKSDAAVRFDGDGVSRDSTIGGVPNAGVPETVTSQANGLRSHTSTGLPGDEGDGLSATSEDNFDETNTQELLNFTADATTATALDV